MPDATSDLTVDRDGAVAWVEIHRPPNNYFDIDLIAGLADVLESLAAAGDCRVVVLCAEGKHFCAGAQLANRGGGTGSAGHLYDHAVRIFESPIPMIAAVQGAAIGGGLGLAMAADFRVATPESRWTANFARLGFHHGFGLSVTLPRLVGAQAAAWLLYTGERVGGERALELGLCDQLVEHDALREAAMSMAESIAGSAPLAVRSIRDTLRGDIAEEVRSAVERERSEQERLMSTDDFREGVAATAARRDPEFVGR